MSNTVATVAVVTQVLVQVTADTGGNMHKGRKLKKTNEEGSLQNKTRKTNPRTMTVGWSVPR